MSKKLPFEEALKHKLSQFPVPDEDAPWEKMKLLLKEKNKRRPFVFFKDYAVWTGILLILGTVVVTFLLNKKHSGDRNISYNVNSNTKQEKEKNVIKDTGISNVSAGRIYKKEQTTPASLKEAKASENKTALTPKSYLSKSNQRIAFSKRLKNKERNRVLETSNPPASPNANASLNKNDSLTALQNNYYTSRATISQNNTTAESTTSNLKAVVDSVENLTTINSVSNTGTLKASSQKNILIKRTNHYFLDAGIQMRQQLPIVDQKLSAYNFHGNKNLLYNYIPSVFVKFQKNNQWFAQGEFLYASPQAVNRINYAQQTIVDYAHGITAKKTYQLQKAYYSQLPVSINVYIKPNWSVGAGFMQNWLSGAVAHEQVVTSYAQTNKEIAENRMVPTKGFIDSFLYKSHGSIFFQTIYEKNKWSISLRFTHDTQPFITYTLPNGAINNKRNNALEILVRYRLLRFSKMKVN